MHRYELRTVGEPTSRHSPSTNAAPGVSRRISRGTPRTEYRYLQAVHEIIMKDKRSEDRLPRGRRVGIRAPRGRGVQGYRLLASFSLAGRADLVEQPARALVGSNDKESPVRVERLLIEATAVVHPVGVNVLTARRGEERPRVESPYEIDILAEHGPKRNEHWGRAGSAGGTLRFFLHIALITPLVYLVEHVAAHHEHVPDNRRFPHHHAAVRGVTELLVGPRELEGREVVACDA